MEGQTGEGRKEGRACLVGSTEDFWGLVGEPVSPRAPMPGHRTRCGTKWELNS